MVTVTLRFYEELNDFLPRDKRRCDYPCTLAAHRSVKDVIEAEGVPHTEVDLILVNGESVGFDHALRDGDRVSIYPCFEALDVSAVSRLGRAVLRQPRFVADVHLGKLARYLRFLGLDCHYAPPFDDAALAEISHREHRVLLTRDRGLLKRGVVDHGICIRSGRPLEQAREVIRRLHLEAQLHPFSRCPQCNGLIVAVAKEVVAARIPPHTAECTDDFYQCQACGQLYWEGSHFARLTALVAELLEDAPRAVAARERPPTEPRS